jgi:ATP synthase protein I
LRLQKIPMLTLQKRAYWYVFTQTCVVFLISGLLALLNSKVKAWSALLGGLSGVVPNLFMVTLYFRVTGARQAKAIVKGFYRGECLKMILTALLVAVSMKYAEINLPSFLMVFIIIQGSIWIAPLFLGSSMGRTL